MYTSLTKEGVSINPTSDGGGQNPPAELAKVHCEKKSMYIYIYTYTF